MVGLPQALTAVAHMRNPSLLSPSIAARISINTGPNAFYGEKYKVEKVMTSFTSGLFSTLYVAHLLKVFEDDGKIMSGITSAVYDSKRRKLFMNGMSFFQPQSRIARYNLLSILGVASPQLVVCSIWRMKRIFFFLDLVIETSNRVPLV